MAAVTASQVALQQAGISQEKDIARAMTTPGNIRALLEGGDERESM